VHARLPALAGVVLIAMLTGCAGGTAQNALPAPVTPAAHAAAGASIVIHIPKRAHRARRARGDRPNFVSPSTKSASIAFAPATGCGACTPAATLNVGLTASSKNCTSSASGLTCTLSVSLRPGNYTASMRTYDGALSGGATSGTVLSENQSFAIAVVAAKANVTNITLDGVPSSMQFASLDPSLVYRGPANVPTFLLLGAGAHGSFSANAIDADGNIIAGPGAPALAVKSTGGYVTSLNGNTISITAPATVVLAQAGITFTLTSPACSDPAASCTIFGATGFLPVLAIANAGDASVKIVATDTSSANPEIATITSGITSPQDLRFDASGNLFVANYVNNGGSVLEYAPPYTGTPLVILSGISAPAAIDIAPNGNLAVANASSATTLVFAPPYTGAPITIPAAALALTFDVSNNLWLGTLSSSVQRYPGPAYTASNLTITDHVERATSLAIDDDGHLMVGDNGKGEVNLYQPPYASLKVTEAFYGTVGGFGHVAVNPITDAFLVCAAGTNQEMSLKLFNVTALAAVLNASPSNCQGAFDSDGYLWITDLNGGAVYGIAPTDGEYTDGAKLQATLGQPGPVAAFPGVPH
jgi:hypothetical protein